MSKVTLRLRELDSGNPTTQECASVEDACAWLGKRPDGVEVLGVVFEGLTREENDRMRAAMRPFSEEEKARVKVLDEREAAVKAERAEARRVEIEAENLRLRAAAGGGSPDRPMEVRYRFDSPELGLTDAMDDRPVSEDARIAVMAWVDERQEWVASRGQVIGEAKVTVYPNVVPAGKDRVVQGTFVPVTAPAKA